MFAFPVPMYMLRLLWVFRLTFNINFVNSVNFEDAPHLIEYNADSPLHVRQPVLQSATQDSIPAGQPDPPTPSPETIDLEDTPDGETTRKKRCGRSSWAILGASALGLTLVFFLVVVIVLMQSLSKLEQNADLKSEAVPSLDEDHVNRDQLLSGQIDDLNDKV